MNECDRSMSDSDSRFVFQKKKEKGGRAHVVLLLWTGGRPLHPQKELNDGRRAPRPPAIAIQLARSIHRSTHIQQENELLSLQYTTTGTGTVLYFCCDSSSRSHVATSSSSSYATDYFQEMKPYYIIYYVHPPQFMIWVVETYISSCEYLLFISLSLPNMKAFQVLALYASIYGTLWYYMWGGYSVAWLWFLIQYHMIELVHFVAFNPKSQYDAVDKALAVVLAFLLFLVTSYTMVDLVPENANADSFRIQKFLSSVECDEIVRIVEDHASVHGWLTKRHKNYPTTDFSIYDITKQTIHYTEQFGSSNSSISAYRIANSKEVLFEHWLNATVSHGILPLIASYYSLDLDAISMQDLFVVKYDGSTPGAQNSLEVHQDSSQISFNVALSSFVTSSGDGDGSGNDGDESAQSSSSSSSTSSSSSSSSSPPSFSFSSPSFADSYSPYHTQYSGGGTSFEQSGELVSLPRGDLLLHPSRVYHSGKAVTSGVRYILVGFVNVGSKSFLEYMYKYSWRRYGTYSKCFQLTDIRSHVRQCSFMDTAAAAVTAVGAADGSEKWARNAAEAAAQAKVKAELVAAAATASSASVSSSSSSSSVSSSSSSVSSSSSSASTVQSTACDTRGNVRPAESSDGRHETFAIPIPSVSKCVTPVWGWSYPYLYTAYSTVRDLFKKKSVTKFDVLTKMLLVFICCALAVVLISMIGMCATAILYDEEEDPQMAAYLRQQQSLQKRPTDNSADLKSDNDRRNDYAAENREGGGGGGENSGIDAAEEMESKKDK